MDVEAFEKLLETKLDELLENSDKQKIVVDAIKYAVLSGGKRLRPRLVYEFCSMCGGKPEYADSAAVAIEFVQAFSLIHDDLPCMDDDYMRRGKPSCHAVYGEAVALLAGDALGPLAAEVIAADKVLSDRQKLRGVLIVTGLSGVRGMIGGQILDMIYGRENNPYNLLTLNLGEPPVPTVTDIETMYLLKTGALLSAACQIGCICGDPDVSEDTLRLADEYANKLGLAYQIRDDILDIEGNPEILGKPVCSDVDNGKLTILRFITLDEAKKRCEDLTNEAAEILKRFPHHEHLHSFTMAMLKREK
jgi:geranylgeranyl diphosphate synthase type II